MLIKNIYWGEGIGTFCLVQLVNIIVLMAQSYRQVNKTLRLIFMVTTLVLTIVISVKTAIFFGSNFADINPAITLARYIHIHPYELKTLLSVQCVQFLGAFTAGVLTYLFCRYYQKNSLTEKLRVFNNNQVYVKLQNAFFYEIIITAILTIGISTFINDFFSLPGIVFWFSICGVAVVTQSAINPALHLGPRLACALFYHKKFYWQFAIIPILGPYVGAAVGILLLKIIENSF